MLPFYCMVADSVESSKPVMMFAAVAVVLEALHPPLVSFTGCSAVSMGE